MITNKDLTYSKYIELCSMLCGNLDGRGVWGRMYACICVAESLVVHLCLHIPPSLLHPLSSAFCTDPFHPCACAQWLSHVRLFATPWTVAYLLHPWDFPGKSTGVGCHFLLQRIFPTQGSNRFSCVSIGRDFFTTVPPGKPQHKDIALARNQNPDLPRGREECYH